MSSKELTVCSPLETEGSVPSKDDGANDKVVLLHQPGVAWRTQGGLRGTMSGAAALPAAGLELCG